PRGGLVAYARGVGNLDDYIVPPDGGTPIRLTDEVGREIVPSWSPDGRYLAYMALPLRQPTKIRDERSGAIKRIALSRRRVQPVTLVRGKVEVFPMAWQPSDAAYPPADGFSHPHR